MGARKPQRRARDPPPLKQAQPQRFFLHGRSYARSRTHVFGTTLTIFVRASRRPRWIRTDADDEPTRLEPDTAPDLHPHADPAPGSKRVREGAGVATPAAKPTTPPTERRPAEDEQAGQLSRNTRLAARVGIFGIGFTAAVALAAGAVQNAERRAYDDAPATQPEGQCCNFVREGGRE